MPLAAVPCKCSSGVEYIPRTSFEIYTIILTSLLIIISANIILMMMMMILNEENNDYSKKSLHRDLGEIIPKLHY